MEKPDPTTASPVYAQAFTESGSQAGRGSERDRKGPDQDLWGAFSHPEDAAKLDEILAEAYEIRELGRRRAR